LREDRKTTEEMVGRGRNWRKKKKERKVHEEKNKKKKNTDNNNTYFNTYLCM
jgi:hypothetical protein